MDENENDERILELIERQKLDEHFKQAVKAHIEMSAFFAEEKDDKLPKQFRLDELF